MSNKKARYNKEGMTDAHEHLARLCAAFGRGDDEWRSVLDNTQLLSHEPAVHPANRSYLSNRKGKFTNTLHLIQRSSSGLSNLIPTS